MKYLYEFKELGLSVGYDMAYYSGIGLSKSELNDEFIDECLEAEVEHYRQYSPFEFYANDMNNYRDPDRAWEVYENAVYSGILRAVRELRRLADDE